MKSPYKLTPIHGWHMKNGAQTSIVNGWVRVLKYGDSQAEIDAGGLSAGVCDITPLSKIEIQGARISEVLQSFAGVVMPAIGQSVSFQPHGRSKSAYIVRLTSERCWVLADVKLREQLLCQFTEAARESGCMHATDVTSSYAAILIVGSSAGALLKKLGSAPIDQMVRGQCIQTATARVWSLVIRNEVRQGSAWMLLVSRDYGEYVWESVLAAGSEFGIQPLGMLAAEAITGAEENNVAAL